MNRGMALMLACSATAALAHEPGGIHSEKSTQVEAAFDLVHTRVSKDGEMLVFEQLVDGQAGSRTPSAKGSFAGAEVYSYVWPASTAAPWASNQALASLRWR